VPIKKEKLSLSVTHPELAKQADGWDPSRYSKGMKIRLDWKCSQGHKWSIPILNRVAGSGCPFCSGHKVTPGQNDFASSHPELLKYVDGWDPEQISSNSNKRLGWVCLLQHRWQATVNNVVSAKSEQEVPCPYCRNKKVLTGFNDLLTTHLEIAKQANGWDPTTEIAGSHKRKSWKCGKGHIWESVVYSRTGTTKTGCPFCAHQKVWKGFNDLATLSPKLASEANGWDPTTVNLRSNQKLAWTCINGHNWEALLSNRGKGIGCPYCANQKVLPGFNDLKSQYPEIAIEAFGWDPATVTAKTNRKQKWRCKFNHLYTTTPAMRLRGDGCPICSGHQVLVGFNDLKTLNPDLAKQAFEWDPTTVTFKSSKRRKWQCAFGHVWMQSVGTRAAGIGCPTCAKSGFDPNNDAYLYFLEHSEWEMFQIGITNVPDGRLGLHRKNGWKVLELRGPLDGHLTQQWETSILRMLKAKGADLSNSKIAGKFDGYSEAWSKSTFEAKSIKELMRLTEEFEGV